ncbi:unnamed protein product [Closterium sp. Yama58-4]|nr:unnamed protein product [Closterium sp. Yama58-4]
MPLHNSKSMHSAPNSRDTHNLLNTVKSRTRLPSHLKMAHDTDPSSRHCETHNVFQFDAPKSLWNRMGNGISVGGVPQNQSGGSTPAAQSLRGNNASTSTFPVDSCPPNLPTSRIRPSLLSLPSQDVEPSSACPHRKPHNIPPASPFSPFPAFPTLAIPRTSSHSLLSAAGAADDASSLRSGANAQAEAGCVLRPDSPVDSPHTPMGATTPPAFSASGESGFRDREPSTLMEVCAHSGELQWEWYHWLYHGRERTVTRLEVWGSEVYGRWLSFRATWIGRPLQWATDICIYLFLLQSVDRLVLALGGLYLFLTRYRPQPKGRYEADAAADPERPASDAFPMVLVQIPMCNEREVYDQSIAAACQLDWPASRFLVQVLDDSSDEETADMIRAEVEAWAARGAPIVYRHRTDRKGYKAGNLASAMACAYVRKYEFVAIFDADFQPRPDFLRRTVPHFKDQPDVALVQARWSFVNREENLLTRLQHVNLAFHFEIEQQVNGAFLGFFGFNGTAGVWRIAALEDSGGWLDRTTVEDMDLAVRAHLKGWRFVFLNDVEVQCELPQSYEAYRKQQHRWHSGPMHLFRLCLGDIVAAKISLWKKFHLIFLFFLLRKMILPFYSFLLFCVLLPLTIFVPEAALPLWVVCYVPGVMSLLNVLPSPRSLPFTIPYLLFENTMSVTKFHAMVAGLFQLKSAHEWVVTKKTGGARSLDASGGGGGSALGGSALGANASCSSPLPFWNSRLLALNYFCLSCSLMQKRSVLGALSSNVLARNTEQTPRKAKTSPNDDSNHDHSHSHSYNYNYSSTTTPLLRPTPPPSHQLNSWRTTPNPTAPHIALAVTPIAIGAAGKDPKFQSEPTSAAATAPKAKVTRRIYPKELALAALLVTAAARSLLSAHGLHFYFLLFQGLAFLIVGLDVLSDP